MSRRIPRAVSMHMAQNAFARCAEKVNTRKNLTLNRQAVGEVVSYCTMIAANDTLDFDRDKQERLCTEMNHRAEVYTVEMSAYGQPKAREKLRERTAPIAPFRFRDVPDIYAGKMGQGRFESVRPCWGVRFYYSFSLPSRNSMTRCAAYLAFAVSWRCQAP